MGMFTSVTRETIEQILDRRLQIPIYQDMCLVAVPDGSLPEKNEDRRIDVNKVIISMLRDLATITKSGAVRMYSDEYYSNHNAYNEAQKIEDKYFGEGGLDWKQYVR